MGRYLLGKPSRNFVDTRVQLGNINHFAREELAMRIITNVDGLMKENCTDEKNFSTLENTSCILILLGIILNFLERLLTSAKVYA